MHSMLIVALVAPHGEPLIEPLALLIVILVNEVQPVLKTYSLY